MTLPSKGSPSPLMLAAGLYWRSRFGANHPLAIPRVSTCVDLCRAMGWLADRHYGEVAAAPGAALARFHHRDYLAALMDAERDQDLDAARRARFNIGKADNPIFPEIFTRPATAAAAALRGAGLLVRGERTVVHSPASGTHHGRPDRASGFCFLNDVVLAILALLDGGLGRVLYVDIDAHHGDGVQDAFVEDDRVVTISIHEDGRWPFSGRADEQVPGSVVNLPVRRGFNDSEMDFLLETVVLPWARHVAPDAIVLQCGADALEEDPLSRLALSNRSHGRVAVALMEVAPRLLVTGGGGYNPWSVARCWAGVWATLNGLDPAAPLTDAAGAVLRGLSWQRAAGRDPPPHWLTTIADRPRPGPIDDGLRRLADVAKPP